MSDETPSLYQHGDVITTPSMSSVQFKSISKFLDNCTSTSLLLRCLENCLPPLAANYEFTHYNNKNKAIIHKK